MRLIYDQPKLAILCNFSKFLQNLGVFNYKIELEIVTIKNFYTYRFSSSVTSSLLLAMLDFMDLKACNHN